MLKFKALLLDLDGTLLDTAPDFVAALNKQLSQHGRDPLPDSAIRTSVTNGSAGLIADGFKLSPEDPTFEVIRQEYLALYYDNISEKTTLFPGLRGVLDACDSKSIPWGIITNKPWKYSEALLDQLNLLNASAVVICPDHVKKPKPDPEAMFLASSKLKLRPKDCLYIGDHSRDIDAGKAAGMVTIAAGWGYIEETDDIERWNADHLIFKSEDLFKLLFE
jgi:phosphoglycolate phosphatase